MRIISPVALRSDKNEPYEASPGSSGAQEYRSCCNPPAVVASGNGTLAYPAGVSDVEARENRISSQTTGGRLRKGDGDAVTRKENARHVATHAGRPYIKLTV